MSRHIPLCEVPAGARSFLARRQSPAELRDEEMAALGEAAYRRAAQDPAYRAAGGRGRAAFGAGRPAMVMSGYLVRGI